MGDKVYVIEANIRASRSMPLSSKATGINLAKLALRASISGLGLEGYRLIRPKEWWVKSAQFSWSRIRGAYPRLGPVMYSTGEVASSGGTLEEALLKSWLSTSPSRIPNNNALVYTYDEDHVKNIEEIRKTLSQEVTLIDEENAREALKLGKVDILITGGSTEDKDYVTRRLAADTSTPIILDSTLGLELTRAFKWYWNGGVLNVKPWSGELSLGDLQWN